MRSGFRKPAFDTYSLRIADQNDIKEKEEAENDRSGQTDGFGRNASYVYNENRDKWKIRKCYPKRKKQLLPEEPLRLSEALRLRKALLTDA